jgi:hypothetical protein
MEKIMLKYSKRIVALYLVLIPMAMLSQDITRDELVCGLDDQQEELSINSTDFDSLDDSLFENQQEDEQTLWQRWSPTLKQAAASLGILKGIQHLADFFSKYYPTTRPSKEKIARDNLQKIFGIKSSQDLLKGHIPQAPVTSSGGGSSTLNLELTTPPQAETANETREQKRERGLEKIYDGFRTTLKAVSELMSQLKTGDAPWTNHEIENFWYRIFSALDYLNDKQYSLAYSGPLALNIRSILKAVMESAVNLSQARSKISELPEYPTPAEAKEQESAREEFSSSKIMHLNLINRQVKNATKLLSEIRKLPKDEGPAVLGLSSVLADIVRSLERWQPKP